jgi:pimeloyl-ACP methyl ester carboxylesterase
MTIRERAHTQKILGVDIHWLESFGLEPASETALASQSTIPRTREDARTVVLIHGLSDWHRAWQEVTVRLVAQGYRVLALDLPGHGLSGRTDVPYTLEWNALVVGAWLDALKVERPYVVGHSYGGGVAQMLVLTHAQRIEKLALVAPGGFGRRVNVALRFAAMPFLLQNLGDGLLRPITYLAGPVGGRKNWDAEERVWANTRPGTARALYRTVRDVIRVQGQVRHFLDRAHEAPFVPPVGIFWGDRDRVLPVSHAKRLPKYLHYARIVRFPDAGHYPHHDDPEGFTRALVSFLEEAHVPRAEIFEKEKYLTRKTGTRA